MDGIVRPETNGTAQRPCRRLPSVEEALQYSPFTSIFPFSIDIITLPKPPPCVPPTIPLFPTEEFISAQTIEQLDTSASHRTGTSVRLEQTLKTLRQLLNSQDLTHYRLKTPPILPPDFTSDDETVTNGHNPALSEQPIVQPGAFAKMLLKHTDVAFRYPTLVSPITPPYKDESVLDIESPTLAGFTEPHVLNTEAFDHNYEAYNGNQAYDQRLPLKKESSTGNTKGIAIIIPSSSSDPSNYRSYPKVDQRILTHPVQPHELEQQALDLDQQERASAAFQSLQDLLTNVFAAEDQLEPDTSGLVSKDAQEYFTWTNEEEGNNYLLSPAIQARMENAVTKLMQLGQFNRISVDRLARLQKICARSLRPYSNEVQESSGQENQAPSSDTLAIADNSLRASRILVRILTAGRDEKQLYSEETLQELLGNLKRILDDIIIPVVELRKGKTSDLESWLEQKDLLASLSQRTGRVLKLLGDLVLKIDLTESSINAIENMSLKLLFVENASSEKESIIGIQKFETLRRHAMDVVSKIFLRCSEQRSAIFDEILSSLEKLPVGRQSARQFKIVDGKPIQLISALIMQLVQTSAMFTVNDKPGDDKGDQASTNDGASSSDESDSSSTYKRRAQELRARSGLNKDSFNDNSGTTVDDLKSTALPLYSNAQTNASYVVRYLVSRAMTSTKSGDEPYRNLLDIFVEDFLSVLGSTDWPAAQLLLTSLLLNLLGLVDNEKSTAPVRNMALELFGLMGSTIADLQNHVARISTNGEGNQGALDQTLTQLTEETLEGRMSEKELALRRGPFNVVVQFLSYRLSEGLQLQSAQICILVQWARSACMASNSEEKDNDDANDMPEADPSLLASLCSSILNPTQLSNLSDFDDITTQQGRLAYGIIVLNSSFCKAYPRILGTLLSSINSALPTVRNKSLKSVVQLLEKDPSILNRFPSVQQKIINCTADSSIQVRESALGLLGKCMTMKPTLEVEGLKHLIKRTDDGSVSVRKRALKLLKEVYVRNSRRDLRTACSEALLKRLEDTEESVAELAQQTLEELWMLPLYGAAAENDISPQSKQRLREQALLIVGTSQRGEHSMVLLAMLYGDALKDTSKVSVHNRTVCRALVNVVFDVIIDNDQKGASFPRYAFLDILTIFAKADPHLFTGHQLTMLKPYISHLTQGDDRAMYRAVIAIYRRVLPILPPLQHEFLVGVHTDLFQHVSKLSKLELDEVTQCLWIINGVLDNSAKLVRMLLSALTGIEALRSKDMSQPQEAQNLMKARRYIMIVGHFGKNMNLEKHLAEFKERLPGYKSDSWSGLLVDVMCQFTGVNQPLPLREAALENILLVTQTWPRNFLKPQVNTAFEIVFKNREQILELVILSGFKAFFAVEEERSKSGADIPVGDGAVKGAERLGNSMIQTDNDGASTAIAQQYMPYIMEIALSNLSDLAVIATEVITSINRQGLVHPKEPISTLVALETSPNLVIAGKAFEEHRSQHLKHESMLEKEYLTAVGAAFAYQRDLLQSPQGFNSKHDSKLSMFYEVLKLGSPALRKRLLINLCARLNFSPTRLEKVRAQVFYTSFVLENIALFDYGRVDEITQLIDCIEKIVTTTGNVISQRIESHFGPQNGGSEEAESRPALPETPALVELTSASIVLSMFWDTRNYLKRAWSLPVLNGKSKAAAKDVSKSPTRLASANPEKYVQRMAELIRSLDNTEAREQQCRSFLETFMIDHDLRVSQNDEEEIGLGAMRYQTPDQDAMSDDATTQQSGGSRKSVSLKRKPSVSVSGTPRKKKAVSSKKGRASLSRASTLSHEDPEGEWA